MDVCEKGSFDRIDENKFIIQSISDLPDWISKNYDDMCKMNDGRADSNKYCNI